MKSKYPKQIVCIHPTAFFLLQYYPMVPFRKLLLLTLQTYIGRQKACSEMFPKAHGKYQGRGRSGLQVEDWFENNWDKLGPSPGAQTSHKIIGK